MSAVNEQKYAPIAQRAIHGGTQEIYRFVNGMGASVVCHSSSYGGSEGLFELAVIQFDGDGDYNFHLTYDTPITDDVVGRLTGSDVDALLDQIAVLPAAGAA